MNSQVRGQVDWSNHQWQSQHRIHRNRRKTAIRAQLDRICNSGPFIQSERLIRFLRFTVEAVLTGRAAGVKEYTIGTQVYDRQPPYQTSTDSIVRTEASRLRTKLKEYYLTAGRSDPIVISFRLGSYVPFIELRFEPAVWPEFATNNPDDFFVKGFGISATVLPFVSLSTETQCELRARSISDELSHQLMRSDGFHVAESSKLFPTIGTGFPAMNRGQNADVVFEGTVREMGKCLQVNCRATNSQGHEVWSQKLDREVDGADFSSMNAQIVSALLSGLEPIQSIVRDLRAAMTQHLLDIYSRLLVAESFLESSSLENRRIAQPRFSELRRLLDDNSAHRLDHG